MTHGEAKMRSSMISNVSYELIIALPKGGQYFGKVIANFDVKVLAKNGTND